MFRLSLALATVASFANAEAPRVVTDIAVTHSLVSLVMGDVGRPEILLDTGTDPHHVTLRPSQTGLLGNAEVFIWVGAELTPALTDILEAQAPRTVLTLLDQGGAELHRYEEAAGEVHDDHDEEHHDVHDEHARHGDGDDDDGDDHAHEHDHDGIDPHAWLDPANAAAWLDAIATVLAGTDPANAQTYRANADTARARFAMLADDTAAALQPLEGRPVIVAHDAYGYFARAFDVNVAAAIASGDAADPGARHLQHLRELVEAEDIACIFEEPQDPSAAARSLASDTGLQLGTLDPTGASLSPGPDLYEALIANLADEILGCIADNS